MWFSTVFFALLANRKENGSAVAENKILACADFSVSFWILLRWWCRCVTMLWKFSRWVWVDLQRKWSCEGIQFLVCFLDGGGDEDSNRRGGGGWWYDDDHDEMIRRMIMMLMCGRWWCRVASKSKQLVIPVILVSHHQQSSWSSSQPPHNYHKPFLFIFVDYIHYVSITWLHEADATNTHTHSNNNNNSNNNK